MVGRERADYTATRAALHDAGLAALEGWAAPPAVWRRHGLEVAGEHPRSAADALTASGASLAAVLAVARAEGAPADMLAACGHPRIADSLEVGVMYRGYIARQAKEIAEYRASTGLPLPPLDYATLSGLSAEERVLLGAAQPGSVAAAGRIAGVRPATLLRLFQVARASQRAQQPRREHRV